MARRRPDTGSRSNRKGKPADGPCDLKSNKKKNSRTGQTPFTFRARPQGGGRGLARGNGPAPSDLTNSALKMAEVRRQEGVDQDL